METTIIRFDSHQIYSHLKNFKSALCIATLGMGLAFSITASSQSTAPLLQASDLTYMGAFAMPKFKQGDSYFDYGGYGLTAYNDPASGKLTLFLEGHAQYPGKVAQIEVPDSSLFKKSTTWSDLTIAKVIQPFKDITDGKLSSLDPTNPGGANHIYGLLPYNGRLIIGASNNYSPSQVVSHGVSGLLLSTPDDFKGFYSFTGTEAPSRALGGTMIEIPPEWQSSFGGQALTGMWGLSIVGTTSAGPALTVFNPDDVGVLNPIPGKTVLYYPLEHPACGSFGCQTIQNSIYNLALGYAGMAFPPGTRSILFIGAIGTGPYCYGTGLECNDPYMVDKGQHASPYQYQIWAYDANDILAVKNGTKKTWEPKPYAIWKLDGMAHSYNTFSRGATYDPNSKLLFIAQAYATSPRIEVYKINISTKNTTSSPTNLLPPSNLRIQ